MVRNPFLILCLLLCPLLLQAQAPFSFFHPEAGEAFADHPIYHISQDNQGEIWIATGGGLVNMNGIRTRRYAVPDGLSTNDIRVVLHNEDGSAWIATADQLLKMTPEKKFIPHGVAFIRENRIFDIARDKSNSVWFLGAEQVFCLDSLGNVNAWSKGETGLSGAWKIDHGYQDGGIRIFSSSGSIRMTKKGPSPVRESILFSGYEMQPYLEDNENDWRRYIVYKDELVLALVEEDDSTYHPMTVLSSDLTNVLVDREGNIWVGTQSDGLYMISYLQVNMLFDHLEGIQENMQRSDKRIVTKSILGEGGLSLTIDNWIVQSGEETAQWQLPKEEQIQSLVKIGKGWIAASSASLFYSKGLGDSVLQLTLPGITHLGKAVNDQVLICLGNRFHYQIEAVKLQEFFQSSSPASWLPANVDWAQEGFSLKGIRNPNGTWIILVDGGIIIKPAQKAQEEIGTISIPGDYLDIVSWDSTTVLASARQGGFMLLENGEPNYSSLDALSWRYGPVSAVIADRENQKLWVLAKQGVVQFDLKESLAQTSEGYLIPGTDPLVKTFSSAEISTDGFDVLVEDEVWTISVPTLPIIPQIDLMVNCVYVSGSDCIYPWKGNRNFPSDSAEIKVEFSIGSFSFLQSQIFEYQIDGETWIPIVNGVVFLKSLPIGEYHLFLRLRSGNTILSESNEVLAFVIAPPFYQSWWFVFIAAIMLVALIWSGMNLYYGDSERKKLEILVEQRTRDLDDSIVELQQKNQDLEQFAYITSHDLKSPLRGMIGHLQLIERKYSDILGDQGRQSMGHAVGEAKRMYEMVNDLLDFASVGSEKLTKRKVTLDHLLENLILGMSRHLKGIGNQIEVGPMPVVDVVPGQWETLFRNLIENGIKFNVSPKPFISITHKKESERYHFVVTDNGIGMDEKYQEKAFELYGRLNPEYPGTGIGLAICKKVVDRHGGEIWIESNPGGGTAFHFTVPISEPENKHGRK